MTDMSVDVHCHLFNKDILSRWLRILLALGDPDSLVPGSATPVMAAGELDIFRRFKRFLDVGTLNDSIAIYKTMLSAYGNRYRVVPLMLDLSYISTESEYRAFIKELLDGDLIPQRLQEQVYRFDAIGRGVAEFKERLSGVHEALHDLQKAYNAVRTQLRTEMEEHILPVFDSEHCFKVQIDQLTALKKACGDSVYPFLGVDPRRPGITDFVMNNVGPGRTFHGIKLYPPIGFSPTDPVLIALYRHCSDNRIPVTVHCSESGIATYADSVTVTGTIYDADTGQLRDVTQETIEFRNRFLPHVGRAIKERANMLNNPRIWKNVVEAFPRLYLNLAHLGGDSPDWRTAIRSMMKPDNNLYSDLSCRTDQLLLKTIKEDIFDGQKLPERDRIMYGSDYYMLMLYADDLGEYEAMFRSIFGGHFGTIAVSNTNRFLFSGP